MRNIYITVAILFVATILLFIGAFIYLDKEKHSTYHYVVSLEDHEIGYIKVEKFVTEDRILYRSVSDIPFSPLITRSKSKIILDRKYNLLNYTRERYASGAKESLCLEEKDKALSFVATFESEFACLDKIPVRGGTFVFEEDSPVTYLAVIENYDFKKGRAQGFNAITPFSISLPPMKRFVTLTSIRDEYLKFDSKKIKTEHLLLKIRNYPQSNVWVAKSDRSLVMLELPDKKIRVVRTFHPRTLEAKVYALKSDEYVSRDAVIKGKGIQLAGTLTVPNGEKKYPGILLVCGDGPDDRDYQGFFYSLADRLSKNGFCVLRVDRRGIGSSGGDFSASTDSDEIEDIKNALEYLMGQKEVDPEKIIVLGHSKGAFYASMVASASDSVKALVLMAPGNYTWLDTGEGFERLKKMASELKWSEDYLKLCMNSILEAIDKIKSTNKNWVTILGKRCFLKKLREEMVENPAEYFKKIKIPVLMLQGKGEGALSMELASTVDKYLEEGGNEQRTLTYFGYVGHFFGKRINDGIHRVYYEIDDEVFQTIKNWLNKNLEKPLSAEVSGTPAEDVKK